MIMDRWQGRILIPVLKILEDNVDQIKGMQLAGSENELADLFEPLRAEIEEIAVLNLTNIILSFIKDKGFGVEGIIEYLYRRLDSEFDPLTFEREAVDGFDSKHGTRTGFIVEQYMLREPVSVGRFRNAARYHPSPVRSMCLALDHLRACGIPLDESVFIDVGSGMGRNLLIASEYPFKKIIGVELSKELHEIAEDNIKIYKTESQMCEDVESCCMDILDFEFPNFEFLILYFWVPFYADIYDQLHLRMEDEAVKNGRKIVLVFLGDVYEKVVQSDLFSRLDFLKTEDLMLEGEYFSLSFFVS